MRARSLRRRTAVRLFVVAARTAAGAVLSTGAAAQDAAGAAPLDGEVFARTVVTVTVKDRGKVLVPSPFTVLPGGKQVAIFVPTARGVFLLEGEDIVHHLAVPSDMAPPLDLASDGRFLVAGKASEGERVTVSLQIFDLDSGLSIQGIRSANPYLRMDSATDDLWRVIVEDGKVGVYQPQDGANYPMWSNGDQLSSVDQVGQVTAGIGTGDSRMVPATDGTVRIWRRSSTKPFADVGPDDGEFLDPVGETAALFLRREERDRTLLPDQLSVRLVEADGRRTDAVLRCLGEDVPGKRRVLRGRPVRVVEGRMYWLFLGKDFVEVRVADLPGRSGARASGAATGSAAGH